ncbi:MAG: hypothetical protein KatS3mg119_0750 [Rhodothalassiaceae bacterium]|nr:MAG: hypothetical protein KatS3mg119_0750 [Rhodothalassiaceae bacterium]
MAGAALQALLASLVAAALGVLGIVAARAARGIESRHATAITGLAAGLLLGAALLHLLPEAGHRLILAERPLVEAGLAALAGFLLLFLIAAAIGRARDASAHEEAEALFWLPVVAIALHAASDGLAYAMAAAAGEPTLWLILPGLALHKVPEGFLAYGLVLAARRSPGAALVAAGLAVAGATVAGTAGGILLLSRLDPAALALIMAFTAGALIHVAAAHLLPHIEHDRGRGGGPAFVAGLGLTALAALVFAH